ncbi:hypothetical protein ACFFLM_03735 [Deinococcus oregonensis]|uniref:Uncharacterized protein n=1 Tax=Deinococcus oregonensis TaxID=1805970 RepID=A0ABV6AUA7_9DEIO
MSWPPLSAFFRLSLMRESEWRAWLQSLPTGRARLQGVQAELEWQVTATDARLTAAVWQGNKAGERAIRIELNELNSKLLLIRSQIKSMELPPLLNTAESVV